MRMCDVFSITVLASLTGFLISPMHAQAPAFLVEPSMIAASISCVPVLVKTLPLPALKKGQSSSRHVTASATSTACAPPSSRRLPSSRIFLNSCRRSSMVSTCLISPAPPCMAMAHSIGSSLWRPSSPGFTHRREDTDVTSGRTLPPSFEMTFCMSAAAMACAFFSSPCRLPLFLAPFRWSCTLSIDAERDLDLPLLAKGLGFSSSAAGSWECRGELVRSSRLMMPGELAIVVLELRCLLGVRPCAARGAWAWAPGPATKASAKLKRSGSGSSARARVAPAP
mmetsp:Transcript_65192/g.160533  ORF Transcript_65192/g.160533 Transcript_65192/m.160533 type:complete len:282 (+) Transcript_65192:1154-1999(+)